MPGATATGHLAHNAMIAVPIDVASTVATKPAANGMPASARNIGFTATMKDIVRNVLRPARISRRNVVFDSLSPKNLSMLDPLAVRGAVENERTRRKKTVPRGSSINQWRKAMPIRHFLSLALRLPRRMSASRCIVGVLSLPGRRLYSGAPRWRIALLNYSQ